MLELEVVVATLMVVRVGFDGVAVFCVGSPVKPFVGVIFSC